MSPKKFQICSLIAKVSLNNCKMPTENPIYGHYATLKPSNCQTMWVIELKSLNFSKEMPVYLNFEY